jgi:uncharacterized protein YqgV (UPF0045/DUF77 family)
MILLEFSMSPMDKGESVSEQVSRSLKIIDESGVPYRLNPMGTVLEGEFYGSGQTMLRNHEERLQTHHLWHQGRLPGREIRETGI